MLVDVQISFFLIIFISEYKSEREIENVSCFGRRQITKQPMTIAAKMRKEKKKALRPRFKLYGFFFSLGL